MSKFSVDINSLSNTINKKSYKLSEVSDKIEKVAFDIVRFKDCDDRANLWQIQSADDGDYIVSMYEGDTSGQKISEASSSSWEVIADKSAGNLMFYRGDEFVVKVAAKEFGVDTDLDKFSKHLTKSMSSNDKLVKLVLKKAGKSVK
jgi:hypothetical protein